MDLINKEAGICTSEYFYLVSLFIVVLDRAGTHVPSVIVDLMQVSLGSMCTLCAPFLDNGEGFITCKFSKAGLMAENLNMGIDI